MKKENCYMVSTIRKGTFNSPTTQIYLVAEVSLHIIRAPSGIEEEHFEKHES